MFSFDAFSSEAFGFAGIDTPTTPVEPGEGGSVIALCIATIMSARPINLQAPMSSAAINLTVSF